MRFAVEIRGAAERDVAEAMDWYGARVPGLDAAFLADFAQVLGRLSESPLIYQVIYRESRRAQLHRFPYLVWFKVEGALVTVRACLRATIDPAKVRRRLR